MPFIRPALLEHFVLMIEHNALDLWLDFEPLWDTRETVDDRFQRLLANGSRLRLARILRLKDGR